MPGTGPRLEDGFTRVGDNPTTFGLHLVNMGGLGVEGVSCPVSGGRPPCVSLGNVYRV